MNKTSMKKPWIRDRNKDVSAVEVQKTNRFLRKLPLNEMCRCK